MLGKIIAMYRDAYSGLPRKKAKQNSLNFSATEIQTEDQLLAWS